MNILFFMEPYPMRNNSVEFSWIAEELMKMLLDEYSKKYSISSHTTKLLCTRAIHSHLNAVYPNDKVNDYILGLTKEENDYISKSFEDEWNIESLHIWKNLLEGKGETSLYYEDILKRVYSKYKFDVIVYWGTNGAVRNFSKNYNIPAIAMEMGCVRDPFFMSAYFDFRGVNGGSYLNEIELSKFNAPYTLEQIETILPIKQFADKSIDALHDVIYHQVADEVYKNSGKNVLIPLQLMDDTNIILYSKYNTMLEFLQDVIPKLSANGYSCYVKPHPGNVVRKINTDDHTKAKKYCDTVENVFWLDSFDNNKYLLSLYSKMDAFVVINSSVGFEAMLLGKIVILLGKSPYNLSNNLPTIEKFISEDFDYEEYLVCITKIVNLLLFHYLYFKQDAFNYTSFINAIQFNMNLFFTFDDKQKFQNTIFNAIVNNKMSYMQYPPRIVVKKSILFDNALVQKYKMSDKVKYRLKRVPLLGKILLVIKRKLVV